MELSSYPDLAQHIQQELVNGLQRLCANAGIFGAPQGRVWTVGSPSLRMLRPNHAVPFLWAVHFPIPPSQRGGCLADLRCSSMPIFTPASPVFLKSRRSWRQLHPAVDPNSGEILALELTTTEKGDASLVGPPLDQSASPFTAVLTDGASQTRMEFAYTLISAPTFRQCGPKGLWNLME
jgi:hypothetical protein